MLQEAFSSGASPALPPSLLQGRITLLYKGKGADRESPASYRPITLLTPTTSWQRGRSPAASARCSTRLWTPPRQASSPSAGLGTTC